MLFSHPFGLWGSTVIHKSHTAYLYEYALIDRDEDIELYLTWQEFKLHNK